MSEISRRQFYSYRLRIGRFDCIDRLSMSSENLETVKVAWLPLETREREKVARSLTECHNVDIASYNAGICLKSC